jgi:hypothetical protein
LIVFQTGFQDWQDFENHGNPCVKILTIGRFKQKMPKTPVVAGISSVEIV